jgi:hypothetical protein
MWRDYLWSYLEGGIDQCIPSIQVRCCARPLLWSLCHVDETVNYFRACARAFPLSCVLL